jgi:tetratricopeptide (TPR) repeat protein
VLGTVAARNYHVGGELHLTTSQFGTNFYIGNRPGATGRYDPLRWGQGSAETERTDAIELAEHAVGRKLSPAEVSRYWFGLGWSYIRTQPGSWLRLVGTKLGFLLNATEITDTEDQYTWGDFSRVLAATNPILHFGVIAPLAAVGVVLAWPRRRKVWILYALLVTYAASVLLFFVNARYRYPLLPLLVPFAAAAVAHPWRATLARRRYGELATAGALAVGLAVVANRRIVDIDLMRAVTLMNLGTYVAEAGDLPSAEQCFARAVELEPDFAEAQYNLGLALLQMNRPDEAVAPFTRAAELAPNEPKARRALQRIQQMKAR